MLTSHRQRLSWALRRLRRRRRTYALLEPGLALVELHDRHLIYADTHDQDITPHLIARGYWERHGEAALLRLIPCGGRAIEVGANMGYFTVMMARALGPSGRLDSFEANPHLAELLRRTVRFNGYAERVRVHDAAVMDRSGAVPFAYVRRGGGSGTVATLTIDFGPDTQTIEVPGVRLDDIFPGESIDLIRTDAEGAEGLILDGARALIARSPGLILCFEWNLVMLAARSDPAEVLGRLVEAGFGLWTVEADSTLRRTAPERLIAQPFADVVASRTRPRGATG